MAKLSAYTEPPTLAQQSIMAQTGQTPVSVEPAPVIDDAPAALTAQELFEIDWKLAEAAIVARDQAVLIAARDAELALTAKQLAQFEATTENRILLTDQEADAWPTLMKIMNHTRTVGPYSQIEVTGLDMLIERIKSSIVFPVGKGE